MLDAIQKRDLRMSARSSREWTRVSCTARHCCDITPWYPMNPHDHDFTWSLGQPFGSTLHCSTMSSRFPRAASANGSDQSLVRTPVILFKRLFAGGNATIHCFSPTLSTTFSIPHVYGALLASKHFYAFLCYICMRNQRDISGIIRIYQDIWS